MDDKIEKATKKLLEMYEKIENDLLIKIASHFSMNEEFLNSDHWRIKKLEEMGLFNQEVIDYLAQETRTTPEKIKNALNQVGIDTVNMNHLNRLFEDEVLKIDPKILSNNGTIKTIVNTAYNELTGNLIQMSNKIEKATKQAYLGVVEDAYLKTSMGTHSYQEAIRSSINDLSNKGIDTLTYKIVDKDGNVVGIRHYDIEGAVRREVLTASRKLSNEISLEVTNELDSEYLYLSEHLQCRETHFDWQGTVIKKEDLICITHYGEVDGLGGINCRHYFEPYFGEARGDELKRFSKKECIASYNDTQKQRYLERGIRKWKRKAEMFKANNDMEAYKKCKDKVKEWQQRNKQFAEENNLRRDFTREYATESKKKILPYKDVTQEWMDNATPNSHEVEDQNHFEYEGVKYEVDNKNVILDYSSKEKEIAEWLENKFGGELYMIPRINNPQGIETPDYLFRNEYWDLKEITGNGKHTLDSAIKKKKNQSTNFIFDITNSQISKEESIKQLGLMFKSKDRKWLEKIILKKKQDVIVIFERKKRD